MATLHVWKISPFPNKPYPNKNSGAHTITAALKIAKPNDKIIVHGDCTATKRCVYNENIVIKQHSLSLTGREWPIIDGKKRNRTVDFDTGSDNPCSIDSFEIMNGSTKEDGGGIRVNNCSVVILNNCIHNNFAKNGGGIAVIRKGFLPIQTYVNIQSNSIKNNKTVKDGGGIVVIGEDILQLNPRPYVKINNNNITENQAGIYLNIHFVHGGGISVFQDNASINGNVIHQNRASALSDSYGGGVGVTNIDENSTPHTAVNSYLFFLPWGFNRKPQVELIHNHIYDNISGDGGGVSGMWGVYNYYKNNTIEKNRSFDDGGGIYSSVLAYHVFDTGNKIHYNQSTWHGGGIHGTCKSKIEFIDGNQISNNTAQRGHGGGISIRNSELIKTGNSALSILNNSCSRGNGGGIYVLTKYPGWHFFLCFQDSAVHLDGLIVEDNVSKSYGGGICIEKFPQRKIPLTQIFIKDSIIRNNRSATYPGIFIKTSIPNFGLSFIPPTINSPSIINGCLIEDHNGTGILIKTQGYSKLLAHFINNTVRNNKSGLEYAAKSPHEANITNNLFEGQEKFQIRNVRDSNTRITNNEFNGSKGGNSNTLIGIETSAGIIYYFKRTLDCKINNNNISGHRLYGVYSTIYKVDAIQNWWGNPRGPKVPNGQQPPGADSITPKVLWNPPATKPFTINPPTIPTPAAPNLVAPPKIVFRMLSERYSGLKC